MRFLIIVDESLHSFQNVLQIYPNFSQKKLSTHLGKLRSMQLQGDRSPEAKEYIKNLDEKTIETGNFLRKISYILSEVLIFRSEY